MWIPGTKVSNCNISIASTSLTIQGQMHNKQHCYYRPSNMLLTKANRPLSTNNIYNLLTQLNNKHSVFCMCSVTVFGIINASGMLGLGSGNQLAHWSHLLTLTVQQVAEGLCTKRCLQLCTILHAQGEQALNRSLVVEQG